MKLNKLTKTIVVVSSTTAMAFFAYKAYKTYKKAKEETGEAISGDALQEELKAIRDARPETYITGPAIVQEPVTRVLRASEEGLIVDTSIPEAEEDIFEEEQEDYVYTDGSEERGVEELRFPPNSKEALNQYRHMRMAEFSPISETTKVMWKLWEHKFQPVTKADKQIYTYIIDERREFFGETSTNATEATAAEFILYFARMTDFDIDGGIEYWSTEFLANLDIKPSDGDATIFKTLDSLYRHILVGPNGFGMFALTTEQYQRMLHSVNNSANKYLHFLAQYHEYLIDVINSMEDSVDEFEEDDWDE